MITRMLERAGLRYLGRKDGTPIFIATTGRMRRLLFSDALAFVWGHAIFYRSSYVMRQKSVRLHERRHLEQRRLFGPILFELVYGAMHLLYGYENNPLEKDAYAAERANQRRH